jgi:DNA-binding HxlR family transcriptional regulator
MKRDYGQHCALAKALNVIGGRWTMLIIRELLPGPRRYKDLLTGLPGMGTNMLTDRLRHLEEEGIVERRTLPPPAGSTVYELTENGRSLEAALFELARWGMPLLGERNEDDQLSARWAMLAMKAEHDAEAAQGVNETYEFRIDDQIFSVEVADGDVHVFDGPASAPDVVVTTDTETFYELGADPEAAGRAVGEGRLRTEGDPEAIARLTAIFRPRPGGALMPDPAVSAAETS